MRSAVLNLDIEVNVGGEGLTAFAFCRSFCNVITERAFFALLPICANPGHRGLPRNERGTVGDRTPVNVNVGQ